MAEIFKILKLVDMLVFKNTKWPTCVYMITALFNNMRTLKFKAQPANRFFAAVNQIFGGSS